MRPLRLIMQGFITYREKVEIDFSKFENEIFIISGPTGAGKSTIFDAICFALYGRASTDRRNKTDDSEYRCHYLSPEDPETFVDFTFSMANKKYRIIRKPRQEFYSKRVKGVREDPRKQALYTYEDGEWRSYSEKVGEIDEKIEEIIGLNHSQFTKIVLLPQGEFTAFLSAKSEEKAQILGKIFNTLEIAEFQEDIKNLANDLNKEASNYVDKINSSFSYISEANLKRLSHHLVNDRLDPVNYEDFEEDFSRCLKAQGEALEREEANLKVLEGEEKALDLERKRAGEENEKLALLEELEKKYHTLLDKKSDYDLLEKRIEEAERIESLLYLEGDLIKKDRKLRAAQEERELAKKGYREKKSIFEGEKGLSDGLKERKKDLDRRREKLSKDRDRLEKSSSYREKIRDFEGANKAFLKEKMGFEEMEEAYKKSLLSLEDYESCDEDYENLRDVYSYFFDILNKADRINDCLKDLDRISKDYRTYKKKIEDSKGELEKNSLELKSIEERRKDLESQIERLGLSYYLKDLKEGEACPLCGSIDHPHPLIAQDQDPSDEREKVLEKERLLKTDIAMAYKLLPDYKKKKVQLEGEFSYRSTELESFSGGEISLLDQLFKKLGLELDLEDSPFKEGLSIDKDLSLELNKLEGLKEDLGDIKSYLIDEGKRAKKKRDEGKKLKAKADKEKGQLEKIRTSLAKEEGVLKEKEEELNRNREDLLEDHEEFSRGLRKEEEALEIEERTIEKVQEDFQRASQAFYRASERAENAEKNLKNAEEEKKVSRDDFYKALGKIGLEEKDYMEKKGGVEELKNKKRGLSSYRENLSSARASYLNQRENCAGLKRKDLAALDSKLNEIREKKDLEEERLKKERAIFQKDSYSLAMMSDNIGEYLKISPERDRINDFSQIVRGIDGPIYGREKVDFETYVLIYYFDMVLKYANKRLYLLTEGKFQLKRKDQDLGRQGKQGLDIDVIDIYTGKERSSSSLSGGESFLAALSLALGLSDELSTRTGGKRVETLFIDEGFGSLDRESLDKAIEVLQDLSESDRLIGIISHVDELKDYIPNKILVSYEKDRGSSLRLVRG